MDNGRPPYGGGSPWGQQPVASQNPQGQYTTGQYPVQTPGVNGHQQPYVSDAYGQQPYQQPYPQPVQGQPWQPQMYQPQSHQAQEYQQQSWQPYQQPYGQMAQGNGMYQTASYNNQALQQGYAQQGPQEPVPGQFYPAQGYSGYVSAPKGQEPSLFSLEVIMKVVVFGVLPVLFLLGVIFRWPVLCVLFILAAAGAMVTVWLKDLMEPNMRLVTTLVCGAMGVLSLVVLLLGLGGGAQEQSGSVLGGNASNGSGMGNGMLLEQTATSTPAPTPTVDPYAEAGAAVEQLQSFFYFWHVNNDESMLALTAPSWRNSVSDPKVALFELRKNRTPLDDCEITIGGSEQDTMRKAKVKVSVDKNNGREPERYSFDVIMLKEDGWWYVDPRSLESNEKEAENTPATNTTPTQPPLNTGSPSLTLYYNPDGGSLYHIDANCMKVGSKYKPLKGKFLFSQLNDAPYSELEQCSTCGAPLREN